jgi:glycosyltransferase involved in cell wall biosynthesis
MMRRRMQVFILSYNRIVWLEQCIRSLLAQTYSVFELLVLDNAS